MKKLAIIFPDGEEYTLDYETALDLVMKLMCHEYGWQMYYSAAQLKRNYLDNSPSAFLSEFHFVSLQDVASHLEPAIFIADEDDMDELNHSWKHAQKMFVAESNQAQTTIESYGY